LIYTFSKFNYGLNIDVNNQYLNFSEGGPELTAVLPPGDYTLGQISSIVQSAMNDVGGQVYTVSVDRSNGNKATISAPGPFELLVNTGSNIGTDPFEELGFVFPGDLTGASTYTGSEDAGEQYYPQFMLQSYVDRNLSQKFYDPTVSKTPSGRVSVVSFGKEQFFEMDIKFITNKVMDGKVIKNNPTGLADAIAFLEYVTKKLKVEFIPDVDAPETFFKVLLESAPGFGDGTGFKLKELFSQNLPDFYETGVTVWRVVP
jgi:hypothetical protein